MNRSDMLEEQIRLLKRQMLRQRWATLAALICLGTVLLVGAAGQSVTSGDMKAAGKLECTSFSTKDSMQIGTNATIKRGLTVAGDAVMNKNLTVMGTVSLGDINDLHKVLKDQEKRVADLSKAINRLRKEVYTDIGSIVVVDINAPEREIHREGHLHFDYARKKGYEAGVPNGHISPPYVGTIYLMPQALKNKAANLPNE
jgi:hypothetical protein